MQLNSTRFSNYVKILLLALVFSLPSVMVFAQVKVKGKIVDATTKEALPGVTISVNGKKTNSISGEDGSFSITVVGKATLSISAIGYLATSVDATNDVGTIELVSSETTLKEVIVTNNQAVARKTPVAVSTIKTQQIEEFSANKEFPELLESSPSVFVSNNGGGYGDSKLSIRGFSQENIAVMINGVPVNDMENGSVFWSNWSGLMEIASNVQIQRGLGASKLSIAAVGGNVNIVTKATEMKAGTTVAASLGNNGFIKTGVGFSTGKTKSGFAFSMLASRTSGAGYINGTSFEAFNYFATAAWEINKKNTITATITGAPQWHNQGFAQAYQTLYGNPNNPSVVARGFKFNNSWGYYNGDEFSFNKNFYHKPVANINYYLKLSKKTEISSVLYGSLGRGGGTGANGSINGKSAFSLANENGQIRFDDIEKWNSGGAVSGFGAVNPAWKDSTYKGLYVANGTTNYANSAKQQGITRRSSMNEHNWYGIIVNLANKTSKNLTIDAGIDLRAYKGLHYQRLEDALGVDAYFEKYLDAKNGDINNPLRYVAAGDKKTKIGYNYDGLVKQYGGYLSGTYEKNNLTAFVAATISNTSYQRVDYFHYFPSDTLRKSEKKNYLGYVTKGGLSYRFSHHHFAFANVGYFEKAPFFNVVFPVKNNTKISGNVGTEKILGIEGGYSYRSPYISVNINAYITKWKNKTIRLTPAVDTATGNTQTTYVSGLLAEHKGIELEAQGRPFRKLEITAMASIADWKWKNNGISSTYDDGGNLTSATKIVYSEGLKVGNTAQTTAGIGASYEIIRGLRVRLNYRYLDNLYANFQPNDRNKVSDSGRQAWKLPAYGLLNGAINYSFKAEGKRFTLRLNVDNLLNKNYIQSSFNDRAYDPTPAAKDFVIGDNGSGATNSVYPGFGRTWVFSIKVVL